MQEKDCVKMYWDGFRFGLVVLMVLIFILIELPHVMDWRVAPPDAPPGPEGELPLGLDHLKSAVFLIASLCFWLGWAIALQRLRQEAVAASAAGSTGGGDFLARIGMSGMNWGVALFSIVVSWYAVFDDVLMTMPSLVAAVLIAVVYLLTLRKCSSMAPA